MIDYTYEILYKNIFDVVLDSDHENINIKNFPHKKRCKTIIYKKL